MNVLTALSLIVLLGAQPGEKGYRGPKCLGPFCLGPRVSADSLLKQLGKPATKGSPYCYQSPDGGSFLYVTTLEGEAGRVGSVFLSDFSNCMHRDIQATTDDLPGWKTREGIGLGSTEEEVLKAYGKPFAGAKNAPSSYALLKRGYRQGDKLPKMETLANKYLAYGAAGDELETVLFGIRSGKVSYIFFSCSE
jgi:hypothetical protein